MGSEALKSKLLNLGWLSIEEGLRIAVGLVFTVIAARKLGPEGFGAYAYVLSFVTILAPLARFGLEAHVMREAASAQPAGGGIYVSLAASAIMTVIAAILTIAAYLHSANPPGATLALMIAALPILLTAPFDLIAAYLKGREKMKQLALVRMGATAIFVSASLAVIVTAPSAWNFVVLRSVESGLLAVAGVVGLAIIGGAAFRRIRLDAVRKVLAGSLPLMISVFSTMIFLRIDQVFLGQMSTEQELGHYAVAARIAEIGNIVPALLQSVLFGAMVRNVQSEPGGLDRHMQSVFDAFALCGWGAAIVLGGASAVLLEPVFGAAYAASMPMLLILLLGMPFYFLFYAIGSELIARGQYWSAALLTVIGAITNIALNIVLIPQLDGAGAAWASVISYFVASFGMVFVIADYRKSSWKMARALNPFGAAKRIASVYLDNQS